jgi:hypothetical protein
MFVCYWRVLSCARRADDRCMRAMAAETARISSVKGEDPLPPPTDLTARRAKHQAAEAAAIPMHEHTEPLRASWNCILVAAQ